MCVQRHRCLLVGVAVGMRRRRLGDPSTGFVPLGACAEGRAFLQSLASWASFCGGCRLGRRMKSPTEIGSVYTWGRWPCRHVCLQRGMYVLHACTVGVCLGQGTHGHYQLHTALLLINVVLNVILVL